MAPDAAAPVSICNVSPSDLRTQIPSRGLALSRAPIPMREIVGTAVQLQKRTRFAEPLRSLRRGAPSLRARSDPYPAVSDGRRRSSPTDQLRRLPLCMRMPLRVKSIKGHGALVSLKVLPRVTRFVREPISRITLQSLIEFVSKYAARGGETALKQRRGYRMLSYSYKRIAEEANRLARELENRNLNKGDTVLLWGENSAEWLVVFLGSLLRGVIIVPIDNNSTPEFASRVAQEVNAKLLFHSRAHEQNVCPIPCIILESLFELIGQRDASPYP